MRFAIALAAAAAVLALWPGGAVAQPAPGTELRGTMGSTVDTKSAYVGQDVIVNNVANPSGSIQGATLRGTVSSVVRAGQGRAAQLQLHFNYLVLRNGRTYPVNGSVTAVHAETKSNALKEAGGALAGMLVGNAIFKTLFSASGGGIVGAAGGYLIAKNNRQDMTVTAGSIVVVHLGTVHRQS
jgi:hypothetical protein